MRRTLAALLVLFGLLLIFFWPAIFQGANYIAPDAQAPAYASAPLGDALRAGLYPLWNPWLLGGMPSYASLMWTPYVTPASLLDQALALLPVVALKRLGPTLFFFVAGAGVFVFLRDLKTGRAAALLGAAVLAFMPHLVSMPAYGQLSKLHTAAFLPWAVWAARRVLGRPTLANMATLGLVMGLQLLGAHVQKAYYTWLAVGLAALLWLAPSVRGGLRRLDPSAVRAAAGLAGGLALGLALAAVLIWPVAAYAPLSIRGGSAGGAPTGMPVALAARWSLAPVETLTFLYPGLFGFGGATYWGSLPFTDFPHYAGATVLALAALAAWRWQRGRKASGGAAEAWRSPVLYLLVLLALSLLLAWGEYTGPLYPALRAWLPYYNHFRVPLQAVILAQFALAALAGLGLQAALDQPTPRLARWLAVGAAALGGVALLAMLLRAPITSYLAEQTSGGAADLVEAQWVGLVQSLWRPAVLLAVTAWLFYIYRAGDAGRLAVAGLIGALTVVDLWQVDRQLNPPQQRPVLEQVEAEAEVAAYFRQSPELGRLMPLGTLFQDNRWAAYGVFSAGGYHAARLSLYQGFLDAFGLPEEPHPLALKLLNVRWVLSPALIEVPSAAPVGDGWLPVPGGLQHVYLYDNSEALPRAWLVEGYQLAGGLSDAVDRLKVADFDPARTAVLLRRPAVEPAPGGPGQAEIVHYGLHQIVVETQADTPRLLVLSEVYYPNGWRATVDGAAIPILQADYLLRAVAVPAGQHEVVFTFAPADFEGGLTLSLATLLLIGALLGREGWRRYDQRLRSGPDDRAPL